MKKSHIVAIVVIGITIAIIISTASDASIYVTFAKASELADQGSGQQVHVVGELKKNQEGHVEGIEVGTDLVSFSFILLDETKHEEKVFYNEPMPPDFTHSEKVVVVGSYKNGYFIAKKILLKCPSKYQEKEINVKES